MRPKYVEYEVVFYSDKFFSIEGVIFYDSCSDTFIATIDIIQDDGHIRLELFNRDYKKLDYATKAIHTNYKNRLTKIFRRMTDEKAKQD